MTTETPTAPAKSPQYGDADSVWTAYYASKGYAKSNADQPKGYTEHLGFWVPPRVKGRYTTAPGAAPAKSSAKRSGSKAPSVGRAQLLAYGKAKGVDELLKLKTIIDEVAADVRKAEQEAKAAEAKAAAERAAKEKEVREKFASVVKDGLMTQAELDRIASRVK